MTGRAVGFLALAAIELLVALSLYNQSLALRATTTIHHRRSEALQLRYSEVEAVSAAYVAPSALSIRLALRSEFMNES